MNFGNKIFKTFKDILTPAEHKQCMDYLNQRKWSFDNSGDDKFPLCWSMWDLEEHGFFSTQFLQRIEELMECRYDALRIYANGQSYGLDGEFHTDSNFSYEHTFLYYPTQLDPLEVYEYGGETQFVQDDGQIHHVYPFTNTGVCFDGRIWHRGMGPNRFTRKLRMSIAFKLQLINK